MNEIDIQKEQALREKIKETSNLIEAKTAELQALEKQLTDQENELAAILLTPSTEGADVDHTKRQTDASMGTSAR